MWKTLSGAQGENRTLMMLPSIDFESIASTNSATWASRQIYFVFVVFQTDAQVSASSLCLDENQSSLIFIHLGIYLHFTKFLC